MIGLDLLFSLHYSGEAVMLVTNSVVGMNNADMKKRREERIMNCEVSDCFEPATHTIRGREEHMMCEKHASLKLIEYDQGIFDEIHFLYEELLLLKLKRLPKE